MEMLLELLVQHQQVSITLIGTATL